MTWISNQVLGKKLSPALIELHGPEDHFKFISYGGWVVDPSLLGESDESSIDSFDVNFILGLGLDDALVEYVKLNASKDDLSRDYDTVRLFIDKPMLDRLRCSIHLTESWFNPRISRAAMHEVLEIAATLPYFDEDEIEVFSDLDECDFDLCADQV